MNFQNDHSPCHASRLRLRLKALRTCLPIALLALVALAPLQAVAAVTGGTVQTGSGQATTGTARFDSLDPFAQDGLVRSNDKVIYALTYTTDGNASDDPVTIVSTLPTCTSAPGVVCPADARIFRWSSVPVQCTGAGSMISTDKRTLTCVIPGPKQSGTRSILPEVDVQGDAPDGAVLTPPVTTVTSPNTTGTVPVTYLPTATGDSNVVVKVGALYDVSKAPAMASQWQYRQQDGVNGWVVTFPVAIRVPAGIKGLEAVDTNGLTFTDNLADFTVTSATDPAGAAAVQAAVRSQGKLFTGDSAGACPASGAYSTVWGAPSGKGTRSANSLSSGSVCTATQATPGGAITLNVKDAKWTGEYRDADNTWFPTVSAGGTALNNASTGDNYVAVHFIGIWIPATAFDTVANGAKLMLTNTFSSTQLGTSISGKPITDVDATTNKGAYEATIVRGVGGEKSYGGQTGSDRYRGTVVDGQLIKGGIRFIVASYELSGVVLCERFDNSKSQITGAATIGGPAVNTGTAVIEYGTGDRGGAAAEGWSSRNAQLQGTCADNESATGWTTNLASLDPKLVNKVRVRFLTPVAPSSTLTLTVPLKTMQVSPVSAYGVAAGHIWTQDTPTYNYGNWGTKVAGVQGARPTADAQGVYWQGVDPVPTGWNPTNNGWGDVVRLVGAVASISKVMLNPDGSVSNATTVASGEQLTYRLAPQLVNGSTTAVTSTMRVRDVLPPELAYVPGSASLAPSNVQVDVPKAGYTTLIWDFPVTTNQSIAPITFKAVVDGTAANGRQAPNFTVVTSPLDPPTACQASGGVYDLILNNNYTIAADGTVTGVLCRQAARHDVKISNPGGFQVIKRVDTPLVEPGQPIRYTLRWTSIGAPLSSSDIIDVLPYANDGRSTVLDGQVGLQSWVSGITNDAGPTGSSVYYSNTPPASINRDPSDASNTDPTTKLPTARWCTAAQTQTPGSACPHAPSEVTAVRIISATGVNQPDGVVRGVQISLLPTGNKRGNAYGNNMTVRGASGGVPLPSAVTAPVVAASVVNGSIAGKVFADTNDDGVADAAEVGIANVTITLEGCFSSVDGVVQTAAIPMTGAVTCSGDDVLVSRTATTDANGIYLFDEVSSGRYRITEAQPVGYNDGKRHVGSAGGTANAQGTVPSVITDIVLPISTAATAYDFGEIALPRVTVGKALTAESGATAGVAEAGEQLTYTLTLTNGGQGVATNHSFFEVLPANTTLVSITGSGVTHTCATGDAGAKLCTITVAGPIAASGTSSAQVIVTVNSPLAAGVSNISNMVTDDTTTPPAGCDPATGVCTTPPVCDATADPAHCVVTPTGAPQVTVSKALTAESGQISGVAEAGERLTYTLTLSNSGQAAALNHRFFEALPANTTLVSITGSGVTHTCAAGDAGAKLCAITVAGPLNPTATAQVSVVVDVVNALPAAVTAISNLVTDNDTTPPAGCDPVTGVCTTPPVCDAAADPTHCVVTPVAQPRVTVSKALTAESGATAGVAEAGEQLTYTLTLTNGGQGVATNHSFFEVLPANTTLVSITGSGVTHTCAAGDAGAKLCTITVAGPIAASGTSSAQVIMAVNSPLAAGVSNISNMVTDDTTTPPAGCDPATGVCTTPPVCDATADPAHCVVTPAGAPQVTVSKALTAESGQISGVAEAGERLTYTLTLSNSGQAAALNHRFFEALPANTTLVSITGSGVTHTCAAGDAGAKLCAITVAGPLNPTATAQVSVVVDVVNALPAAVTAISNLVTDNDTTPPAGCDPVTGVCTAPPVCDAAADPTHCVVTPVAQPRVTVSKALTAESGATAGVAEAGEQLTYTLTLTNGGQGVATNHSFFEVLPANTTLVSITGSGVTHTCAAGDAGAKLCAITVAGPISAATTSQVSVVVTVANPLPAGITVITNLVTDDTTTPPAGCDAITGICTQPPTCSAATDPTHCVVVPTARPEVTVVKTSNPASGSNVIVGQRIGYTLTVTVTAAPTRDVVTLTDTPSQALTVDATSFVPPAGISGAACAMTGANVVCTLPANTVPGAYTFTYGAIVAASATGSVDNTVVPTGGDSPTCTAADDCTTSHPVTPSVVTVAKAANPAYGTAVVPGQTITYTVTATVADAPTRDVVTLTDTLGAGLSFVAGSFNAPTGATCSNAGQVLTCTLQAGTAVGAHAITYQVTVDASATGTVRNTVVPSGGDSPTCTAADDCTTSHPVTPSVVTVAKASNPANGTAVVPGQTITYTVTATVADAPTRDVVTLTDTLGAGLSFVAGSFNAPTGATCSNAGQVLTCTLQAGTAVGAHAITYQVTVDASATGTVRNTVVPTGVDNPSCSAASDCTTAHEVVPAVVTVSKTSDPGKGAQVLPGQTITYALNVTVSAAATRAAVTLTDTLGAGLTLEPGSFVTPAGAGCTVSGQVLTCTLPAGAAVGTHVFGYKATVATTARVSVDNTVVPTGDDSPSCSAAADCMTDHPVAAVFTVDKVAGAVQQVAGSADEFQVRYTVTAANIGGSSGTYSLVDTPRFDADASVLSVSVQRGSEAAQVIEGAGPWTLASDRELAYAASDVYTVIARIRVAAGSSRDNDTCGAGAGNGLYNQAALTSAGNVLDDNACLDTPVPSTTTQLSLQKRGAVSEAEVGDMVTYTLRIRNNGQGVALNPTIVDRLPAGFILVGQAAARGAALVKLEGAPGPVLRMQLDRIDPGAEVTVQYRLRLGVGAQQGDGINRAHVECAASATAVAGTVCSNEDRWKVQVNGGVFSEEGCVVGQIFVDGNGNSLKDHEELGIPGVRLYFENGTYMISDVEGKYSYCGLRPVTHVLKVDTRTLPLGSRLMTSSNRNAGDAGSLFIDLKNGELHRADFIEGSASNQVLEQVKARRAKGEIRSVETEVGQPGLKFEGKLAPQGSPLQQGTDSADQQIERERQGQQEPPAH